MFNVRPLHPMMGSWLGPAQLTWALAPTVSSWQKEIIVHLGQAVPVSEAIGLYRCWQMCTSLWYSALTVWQGTNVTWHICAHIYDCARYPNVGMCDISTSRHLLYVNNRGEELEGLNWIGMDGKWALSFGHWVPIIRHSLPLRPRGIKCTVFKSALHTQ